MKKTIKRTLLVRILAVILAAVVVSGNVTPVYAAQKSSTATKVGPLKELTGLVITGLDEPVPGVPFDTGATVVSAEGVSWDIPVIWVDESGKKASVPAAGKRYYPSFVFYIPAGYKISGADANGKFTVQLPSFVTILSGQDGLVFAADPSTGITYIFCPSGYATGQATVPAWSLSQNSLGSDSKDSSDSDPDEPEDPISEKVRMYCADSAIDTLGNDFLEWFIDIVKNTLVPQAANLLREKFPESLGSAQPGYELSHNIGIYIYYRTGEIVGYTAADYLGAFVLCTASRNELKNIMGINTLYFTEYDAAAEKWIVNDEQKTLLDNFIVHEMLHAFMHDYNRYGMYDHSPGVYPLWFKEGLASSVQNTFQYRQKEIKQLADINPDTGKLYFVKDSVLSGYKNPKYVADDDAYRLDLIFSNEIGKNDGSIYVSGYLASVYLGYLDALSHGEVPVDENGNVNIDVLRGGVNNILKRLHGSNESDAETLDAIINDISGVLDERYRDTADFQDRFIKGTDGNGDGNGNDNGSLAFVTTYLTWLGKESHNMGGLANGSILFQDQDYYSPLDWTRPTISEVYRIPNMGGVIESDVDIRRANLTGGTSTIGDGTQNYVAATAAACKASVAPISESAAEPVQDENPNTPSETEPITDLVAATDPEPAPANDAPVDPLPEQEPVTEPMTLSEPDTTPQPDTISEPDSTESEPEAASVFEPTTEPTTSQEPVNASVPEIASEPEPGSDPGTATEPEPSTESETKSVPEAASAPETSSESEGESGSESESDSESESESSDESGTD